MKKIGKNLDIIYEKNKNKIVVNIYSNITAAESIYHSKERNNKTNNDTLNFISNIFSGLEFLIINLHNYIIYSFPSFLLKLYRFQYILLLTTLLFSFVCSSESNLNISTNLVISAYFPKTSNIVYFKSENLKEIQNKIQKEKKSQKTAKKEEVNEKNLNDKINSMNEDIKNYIHTSGNTKSTHVNYEQKECIELTRNNSSKGEIYLFFIIPIKSFTFSVISISSLILFIKTEFLSKLSHLFIFNLACILAVENGIRYLYDNSYYLASSFMLLLLLYLFKNLIDSFYLLLGFRREDFEIFSSDLTANNQRQFILKFIILNLLVMIASHFAFVVYKLAINYIIFYLCLLTLISFLCNCLENFSPPELKPLKNILMFCSGLINLTVCKIIYSSYFSNTIFYINSNEEENDIEENKDNENFSFFFVSDLFTFFCFDYLDEFVEQYRKNFNFHKKLMKLDVIMIFLLISIISLCFFSLVEEDINCFLLCIFSCKLIMHYFISVFKIKYIRLLNNIILVLFIFIHLDFSTNIDVIFTNFAPFNKLKIKFFHNLFDLLIILMVTYYQFNIYYYLYFSEKSLNNDELKDLPDAQVNKILEFTSDKSSKNLKIQIIHDNYNKFKIENIIISVCLIFLNHFCLCLISFIYQKYENANIIIDILYIVLIILLIYPSYIILNNTNNMKEYIYTLFISYYLSLRLISIPFSTSKFLYIIFEIAAQILIINYSINTYRSTFMDVIMIIYLICNYTKINKFFVTIDIISLFISPKIKNYLVNIKKKYFSKNTNPIEENEFKNKLTLFSFLAILSLLLFQIYIFRNLEKMINLLEIISNRMEFEDEHNNYYKSTFVYYIIKKINYFFKINILE